MTTRNPIVRGSAQTSRRVAGLALAAALLMGASARADSDFENAFEASLGHFLAFEAVQAAKSVLFYGAPVVAVPYAEPAYYPAAVPVPVPAVAVGVSYPYPVVHYTEHHHYRAPKHHAHRHDRHCGHAGWDRGRGHRDRGDRGYGYRDDRGRGHGGPARGDGRGGRGDWNRYARR